MRNVFGSLEGAADINALSGCRHRIKGGGLAEVAVRQIDSKLFGKPDDFRRGLHSDGQHDHVKGLGDHLAAFRHVADFKVIAPGNRIDAVNPASDESNAVFFAGVVVKTFKVFSRCADVHKKDRAVQVIADMLFGDDGFFDGIHAAYRGAIGVVAAIHVPGTHALEPGNFFRYAFVF